MRAFQLPTLVLITMIGLAPANAQEIIYFLVETMAGWPVSDSAVIPLSNPADIAHARYLISSGAYTNGGTLHGDFPGVTVVPGKDGINRNYLAPTSPEWSWHVEAVSGFWDAAYPEMVISATRLEELYGASPNYGTSNWLLVETVVRELGPAPVYLSVAVQSQTLEFHWNTPSTNYAYTLQAKDSAGAMNWYPVPGAAWPLKTNRWTLPAADAAARFYRVQAERPGQ